MKPVKKQSVSTRTRLLESACEVFARKGYRDTTIADICRRAGTNIAAVNYHFGDKETLYVEAWRLAFHRSLEAHPPDGGVNPDATAEERLHGWILSTMKRFADPESHEFKIIHKELANPTGLLAEVMRKSIEPLQQKLRCIVMELLGGRASEQQVLLCQMSIRAQCFNVMMRQWHKLRTKVGIRDDGLTLAKLSIETIADHVTRFSLAGIREIRRQIENGELTKRGSTKNKGSKSSPAKNDKADRQRSGCCSPSNSTGAC
jgi:AcrR family transcriptional regulator